MQIYAVMIGQQRIMRVMADDEDAARARAADQLDRPGRRGILRRWRETGEVIEVVKQHPTPGGNQNATG